MTPEITSSVKDTPEFKEFCETRELAPGTIINYEQALNKYVAFTGKTLEELLDEAEDEEDAGIRMRKRQVKKYPETLEDLIKQFEPLKDQILLWNVIRIKTGKQYYTFTSPEASNYIYKYLEHLHQKCPDYNPELHHTFFKSHKKSVTIGGISQMFRRISERAGLEKKNGKIIVRPHSLRKYFATTLEMNKIPHLITRQLMGHTVDRTTASYFYTDIDTIRADYTTVLDQLQTNKVQTVFVNQFEDIKQLKADVIEIKDKIEKDSLW